MIATVEGDRLVSLRPDKEHPLPQGYACPKGLAYPDLQNDPDRVTHPLRRCPDGSFERVGWDEAMTDIVARLRRIRGEHGGGAIATYLGNPGALNYSNGLWLQVMFTDGLADDEALSRRASGVSGLRALVAEFTPEATEPRTGIPAAEVRALAHELAGRRAMVYGRTGTCLGSASTLVNLLMDAVNLVAGNLDTRGGAVFGDSPLRCSARSPTPGAALLRHPAQPDRRVQGHAGQRAGRQPGHRDHHARGGPDPGPDRLRGQPGALDPQRPRVGEGSGRARPDDLARPLRHRDQCVRRLRAAGDRDVRARGRPDLRSPRSGCSTWSSAPAAAATGSGCAPAGSRSPGWPASTPHGMVFADRQPVGRLRKVVRHRDGLVHLDHPEIRSEIARVAGRADDAAYPLRLIGMREVRSENSWFHNVMGDLRTPHSARMHPDDARPLGLDDGAVVRLTSRSGAIELPVTLTEDIRPGVVAVPHGWGHKGTGGWRTANANPGVNVNELASSDPADLEPLVGMSHLSGIAIHAEAAPQPS